MQYFPSEITVQYRENPIPRLTSSTVWMWNSGKKTVRGADIVAHDPLQLHFGGEILDVRIKKVSRGVLRIAADTPEEIGGIVRCGFEFLDPGDGGVLEVLHTGPAKEPKYTGTIVGLPKGLLDCGSAWGSSAASRRERGIFAFVALPMLLIWGLIVVVDGVLGTQSLFLRWTESKTLFHFSPDTHCPLGFLYWAEFSLFCSRWW